MQSGQSTPSSPPSRPGRKRLLLVICLVGVAVGLLIARPWQGPQIDCSLTVQPGQSLQAAIDAAAAGDVICLARGTWTENIVIDKPLTLVGRGAGRTVIQPVRLYTPAVEIPGSASESGTVRLERLTISGDGGLAGVALGGMSLADLTKCDIVGMMYGLQVSDSASLTLNECTISDSRQIAVVLRDSARATIRSSRVSDNRGQALQLSGSAQAEVSNSQLSRNNSHGLWLQDGARVALNDCSVSDNGQHGLLLAGQSQARVLGSQLSGNSDQGISGGAQSTVYLTSTRVLSNWHGIELSGEAEATIAGSTISANRWDGIRTQNSAHATISGSTISGSSRGLGLSAASTAHVSNCLIEENGQYGVFSLSTGEVTGQGNRFRENGIDLGGNLPGTLRLPLKEPAETAISWPDERFASLQEAIDALLPGGTLRLAPGTYTAGLTIGTELSIEARDGEVVLWGKTERLPVLSLVDGADLRLAGTTISGGSTGLSVSAGATVALTGCTISQNSQGAYLSYTSSAEMVDCNIVGNAHSGVFVTGSAQATIVACQVSNHTEYGIAAARSARLTVTDSTVINCGWDGGIILWDSSQTHLERNTITNNRGYGVATYWHPCFPATVWSFRGLISGSGNTLEMNRRGDVCPAELEFLTTAEGGEFDLRPQPAP